MAQNGNGSQSRTKDVRGHGDDWYESQWNALDELLNDASVNSAYDVAGDLFRTAWQEHNSRQILTGAFYLSNIEFANREEPEDSALTRYTSILPYLQPVDKALCHAFLAQFYSNYRNRNRWTVNGNRETDQQDLDYKLWPLSRFDDAIQRHLDSALQDITLLRNTFSGALTRFLEKDEYGKNEVVLTPTLYDVLVNMAIDALDGSATGYARKEALLDQQMQYHAAEASGGNDCLLMCLAQRKLDLLSEKPNHDKGEEMMMIDGLLRRFEGVQCALLSQLYYEKARRLYEKEEYPAAVAVCDEGMRLYPASEGAASCSNLRNDITKPEIRLNMRNEQTEQRDMLAQVQVRNVHHLYFRIAKYVEPAYGKDNQWFFAKLPVLKSWEQELELQTDYSSQKAMSYIPAMPAGKYYVMVSHGADFAKEGMVFNTITVCNAALVNVGGEDDKVITLCLVNRMDGEPIKGVTVNLVEDSRRKKSKVLESAVTDRDGLVTFSKAAGYGNQAKCTYHGVEVTLVEVYRHKQSRDTSEQWYILLDRPVYKPGESVSYTAVKCKTDFHTYAWTQQGESVTVTLSDVNFKKRSHQQKTTDAFGQIHGSFVLPQDALPGNWTIGVGQGNMVAFSVQYYKQPKFAVQLPVDSAAHRFGMPVKVKGIALSYAEMPVDGAKVEWCVTRRLMRPLWCRWHVPLPEQDVTVASGSTLTSQDGSFLFTFVPLPDSDMELSSKPSFCYEISAKVTDLNGEVHEQRRMLCVGYQNSGIVLAGGNVASFDQVTYQYLNLENQPLEGDMQVVVEELRQPSAPKLSTGLAAGYAQSMSHEEYVRRYPYYVYSEDELDMTRWTVVRTVLRSRHHASATARNEVALPALSSGVYRVTISTVTHQGDTVTSSQEYIYTAPEERRVQGVGLLWHQLSSHEAEVGETVMLRVGTRFRDVEVIYVMEIDGVRQQYRRLRLSNGISTIGIPVTEEMRGGFNIYLFTAKEGSTERWSARVEVPYSNKHLDVRFVTFRDKLEPCRQETWTLRVDAFQAAVPAHSVRMMLTMYDAALDAYGNLGWNLMPWRANRGPEHSMFNGYGGMASSSDYLVCPQYVSGISVPLCRYHLKQGSFGYYNMYGGGRPLYSRMAKGAQTVETYLSMVENDMAEENVAADGAAGISLNEQKVVEANGEPLGITVVPPQTKTTETPVQIRRNLSTLAFFNPTLSTDSAGCVSLTFTVPELLTRWHIEGVAYTRQMQTGTLQASAVTTKEIMVVPNVPRFLRQGDQMDFLVKVSNATDEPQEVEVTLELADAATGKTFFAQRQHQHVDGCSSCPVTYSFSVPGHIFACTYRVVAKGKNHSDGEQDVIPVLSNRMLVTEGMSIYVNGKGEKHCTLQPLRRDMDALTTDKNTTLQPHRLTVEMTANPIWYAIQALPYVEDHANPSCIFLANSIYANTQGSSIMKWNPEIEQVFTNWRQAEPDALTSKLERNEDIKQTVLRETPWLRDGNNETARMRRISTFFDKELLEKNIAGNTSKLADAQRPDGSWSWMPGGSQGSEYVTSYILKTYGRIAAIQDNAAGGEGQWMWEHGKMLKKAMKYVDEENYKYYLECKKHPGWTLFNIDYLYMRSFYPADKLTGNNLTAYNFFYNNALKNNKQIKDLYSQAQLALVFHRHGDTQAAKDLVRRLRECSLTSDEMGMYWRDNVSGYFWNERPIEVQSLLIEVFEEVTADDKDSPALMRQWLLKQKQTTSWNSDVATVNAIAALAGKGRKALWNTEEKANSVTVTVGGQPLSAHRQSATGYQREQWQGDSVCSQQADMVISKTTDGIAWGTMYWQYFEDLDKVPYSEMGIKMQKTLYRENADGTLSAIDVTDNAQPHPALLNVGDKVRVRILIDCDRNLEYLELKDARPSAFEPVSTESGWHWNTSLSYYVAYYNASTSFFIDRLSKGKYVMEYTMYVSGSGEKLSSGNATIQCMYAPEFRCTTQGRVLKVSRK